MSSRVTQKSAKRVVREQMARERRRRITMFTAIGAAVAIVVAGLIGWGIVAAQEKEPYSTPTNASSDGNGITVAQNEGKPTVDVYGDYLCPNCKVFEQDAGATLNQLVADEQISYVFHPIAILDGASTTDYSTRAASAAACASDLGKFNEFSQELFAKQPPEGGAGLTDQQIIDIGVSVGLADPAFATCVRDGTYKTWVARITDASARNGIKGTPTVRVNGKDVQASRDAIVAAVGSQN